MITINIRKLLLYSLLIASSTAAALLDTSAALAAEDASRDEHMLIGDTILAGDLGKIRKLIEQDPGRLNRLYRGRGILFYPASYRQPEILEYLLEKGADLSPQDRGSPLMDAVDGPNRSSTKCVEILLEYGAPADNGYVSGKGDLTPYFIALRRGDLDIARLLLAHGADGAYLSKFDESALTFLLRDRKNSARLLESAKLAVENGADVNHEVNKHFSDAGTPLLFAAQLGNREVYDYLISVGADQNYKDYYDNTPEEYLSGAAKRQTGD